MKYCNTIMELEASPDTPAEGEKLTLRERLFEALKENAISAGQFEFFLMQKGILPRFSNLRCISPKVSVFLLKHWDAVIKEYRCPSFNILSEEKL